VPVTLDSTSAPLVRRENNRNVSSDGGESGSEKCKRDPGGSNSGFWRSLRLAGIWRQAVVFMLVRLAEICYLLP
jgi:hypothetical protein